MSLTAEIKKISPFYWAGLAAALIAFGADKILNKPFGIVNHNPGNLRPSSDTWEGQTGVYTSPKSGDFLIFADDFHGIRAMARTLVNYFRRYNLNTVSQIVSRYAPASENATADYIDAVAARMGVLPDHPLDVETGVPALVRAMIPHEVGSMPYDDFVVDSAVTSALA